MSKSLLLILTVLFTLPTALQAQTERKPDASFQAARVNNISVFDPLKYPKKALKKGIEGNVTIVVKVDAEGNYLSHTVKQMDDALFGAAVVPYVPKLTFEPASTDQGAVPSEKTITVSFSIERKFPPKTSIDIDF